MKIFHVGSHQFRESLRELLRELWFSYCSSRGMPFREWNFEFRELLREYPGTLRELREWPVHSERVFPEIGVVPRLWVFHYDSKCERDSPALFYLFQHSFHEDISSPKRKFNTRYPFRHLGLIPGRHPGSKTLIRLPMLWKKNHPSFWP